MIPVHSTLNFLTLSTYCLVLVNMADVSKGFNDDICGISFSVRFSAILITIWNRDGDNEEGKEKLKETVLQSLSPEWVPSPQQVYYKKHSDHTGFVAPKGK